MIVQERSTLLRHIRDFLINCDLLCPQKHALYNENAFTKLALALFRYQFENNQPYQKLCRDRGIKPDHIQNWQDIPAVMATSFKYAPLFCGDHTTEAIRVFHTSGTTKNQPGKHYFRTLELYRIAAMRTFKWACLPDVEKMPMLILGPDAAHFPNSSLGQMFSWIVEAYGIPESTTCFSEDGLDFDKARNWLLLQGKINMPIFILATSLALLDFIENSHIGRLSLELPPGSRILDTGGYKSSRHSIAREDFLKMMSKKFSLSAEWLFNEYGMTEMSSQFYETRFLAIANGGGVKVAPPWLRSIACDPATLAPLPEGEKGVLRHFDLANLDSVAVLQTEDVGIVRGRTIELLGRDPDAEPRGCSLLAEEITRS